MAYIGERAGTEFDRDLATSFAAMMAQWDQSVMVMESEEQTIPIGAARTADPAPADEPVPSESETPS